MVPPWTTSFKCVLQNVFHSLCQYHLFCIIHSYQFCPIQSLESRYFYRKDKTQTYFLVLGGWPEHGLDNLIPREYLTLKFKILPPGWKVQRRVLQPSPSSSSAVESLSWFRTGVQPISVHISTRPSLTYNFLNFSYLRNNATQFQFSICEDLVWLKL